MHPFRRLPAALAVGALLSTTVAAVAHADTASVAAEDPSNLLANHSFEDGSEVGSLPGWSPIWPGSVEYFELDETRASEGARSLRVLDERTDGGGGMVADAVPVEAGAVYELSFDMFLVSGVLNPLVYFDDADGQVVSQPMNSVTTTAGQWEQVTLTFEVPAGAVAARVAPYSSIGGVVDASIDNVSFALGTSTPDEPRDPDNPDNAVVNHSFEHGTGVTDLPGWAPWSSTSTNHLEVATETASDGDRSLHVLDDRADQGAGLLSSDMPVEPGEVYELSFDHYTTSGVLQPYVYFDDADGQRITSSYEIVRTPVGEWSRAGFEYTVPSGAAVARVMIYSSIGGLVDAYVDDLYFGPTSGTVPTQPSLPEEITSQDSDISYLGTPVMGQVVTNTELGMENGVSMSYGVYSGVAGTETPGTLVVAETMTGEIVRTFPLDGVSGSRYIARSTDGKIYFVTTGTNSLWVYDPEIADVRRIGLINPDDPNTTVGWSLTEGANGSMYIGTYSQGRLYHYDPADDSITDMGQIDPTQGYIHSLAYDHERGNLYVGAGGNKGQIYKVEPDGTTTALLSEERTPGATEHSFVTSFTFSGDRLFARTERSQLIVITADDEIEYWQGGDKEAFGYHVSERPDAPGRYIFTFSGTFWEYDSATATTSDLGIAVNGSLNDSTWTQLDDPAWPGWTMLAATSGGVIRLNLETGTSDADPVDFLNPVRIQQIFNGPDSMYASGYMRGLTPFDSMTGEAGETHQSGQYEAAAVRDDTLLLAAYGNARLLEYDPAAGDSPREIFTLVDELQDRPRMDYDPGTDRVFMGTVAHYGHNQGALAVHDFATGETEVFTDEIVTDQSIISVLHHDGLVYLGTTLDGALDAPDSGQTDAHFIVWDPDTEQVVQDIVPVAGDEGVTGLIVGPDGLIWGVSEDTVFRYDPQSQEMASSEAMLGHRYGGGTVWTYAQLAVGADGNVYGTNRSSLFRIDPDTMEYSLVVNTPVDNLTVDGAGNLYFSTSVYLFRYTVPVETACDETHTGLVASGLVVPADTVTCLEASQVNGPLDVEPGGSLLASDVQINGGVTSDGADTIQIRDSAVHGRTAITGTSGTVVLAGNTVRGPLICSDNDTPADDEGITNTVRGPATGQCANL
ncbi:carbohydrate binding domain-containing protein [Ruania alba]|uniref:Carbohydrate binding domain-containing protein n=1 Tax=Ruania alba TaxID=648782 RepID=A0A1H5MEL9_9MICO|nr:carbohydrate binding domain-containing protein [Ruania alba]SEE86898.1 Carbohydrate binding domain-containing protein [Ruania alba]